MGNIQVHDLVPVRADERKELNLSRRVSYKQYVKHVNGEPSEACLLDLPWSIVDSVSLYERMDASFNSISDIPAEIPLRLPHLNFINLSHNQLTSLPESFALLFHLKTVLLNHNRLRSLPESFVHLVKLEKLDLSNNHLKELPKDIGTMESLRRLNVSHNQIRSLPPSIGCSETISIILAQHNRLEYPPQTLCDWEGSEAILGYLRSLNPDYKKLPKNLLPVNEFPRIRGSQVQISVPNPQSAEAQYIDAQACTASSPARIKIPLLPPLNASVWDATELRDKILGVVYGAAIGDALGVSTEFMSADECQFHYNPDTLDYKDIVRDAHRVRWRPGDWTTDFDQLVLVLECVLQWAGVVDELDFAARLNHWNSYGFPELGDSEGFVFSNIITKVVSCDSFLSSPHSTAKGLLSAYVNGDGGDLCPEGEEMADNAAVVRSLILGLPFFHNLDEVAGNAIRICLATHADKRCVASCVFVSVVVALMLQGKYDLNNSDEIEELIKEASIKAKQHLSKTQVDEFDDFISCEAANSSYNKRGVSYTYRPVAAGVRSLRANKDFRTSLTDIIMLGNDSNTNASVVGAFLGCKTGYKNLPMEWVAGLRTKQVEWLNTKLNALLDMMGLP